MQGEEVYLEIVAREILRQAELYTREYAYARMRRDDNAEMTNRWLAVDLLRCACYRADAAWRLGMPWTLAASEAMNLLSMLAAFSHCIRKTPTADIHYERVHLYTYGY